jgi:hypothetical protein
MHAGRSVVGHCTHVSPTTMPHSLTTLMSPNWATSAYKYVMHPIIATGYQRTAYASVKMHASSIQHGACELLEELPYRQAFQYQ